MRTLRANGLKALSQSLIIAPSRLVCDHRDLARASWIAGVSLRLMPGPRRKHIILKRSVAALTTKPRAPRVIARCLIIRCLIIRCLIMTAVTILRGVSVAIRLRLICMLEREATGHRHQDNARFYLALLPRYRL